ncbi:hypothetical protein [Amycolatopsis anabasis]|uniref:hypothetical protein n=1 Tax=Amycolatopsis anabasis TaxID=1840409 RepID=UPI00131B09C7|nr:hypothetical protein [Amycolatopsis anabasis]
MAVVRADAVGSWYRERRRAARQGGQLGTPRSSGESGQGTDIPGAALTAQTVGLCPRGVHRHMHGCIIVPPGFRYGAIPSRRADVR